MSSTREGTVQLGELQRKSESTHEGWGWKKKSAIFFLPLCCIKRKGPQGSNVAQRLAASQGRKVAPIEGPVLVYISKITEGGV